MTYNLYAIRDVVAQEYMAPMVDQSDAIAMRNFRHMIMTSGGTLSTHPQDYELWLIGIYYTDSAAIDFVTPRLVLRGGESK